MKTIKQLEKEIEELSEKCCINIHSCSPSNKCEPCQKRFVYIKGKIEQTKAIKKMIEGRIKDLKEAQVLFTKNHRGENPIIQAKITELKLILSKIEGEE